MTVDWLTLILVPLALALFLPASFKARAARKNGEQPPTWTAVAQAFGIVFLLMIVLLQVVGNG
ncbi:hypothetical protein [Amycolatopsis jiangsuensis]|uniref:Uncharacterized protein n=1 Tax=Amycolatopsis jiangsuensis TaxID=1181879 RepID=A0A840J4V3_9PSEU|nr:hypothetical protein [Amycolatopsis jiangsuensis]MBB4688384.1 hypothetical protein [Amycolatopsis jiangsuensis]